MKSKISGTKWTNLKVCFYIFLAYLLLFTPAYAAQKLATIDSVKGTVEVQKANSNKWVSVKKGMRLSDGDKIRTKAQSGVVIKWEDGSIVKLSSYTNFAITKSYLDEKSGTETTNLQLWIGKVYSRVKKVLSPGSSFEIQTPTAIAGVRSTTWSTEVIASGETKVTTYEGLVFVSAKGVTVSVMAGEKTKVLPNQPPVPPEEMTEEEKEEWKEQKDIIIEEEKEVVKEEKEKEVEEEKPITLTVEYPAEGVEVEEERIRVSGKTDPDASLLINGVGVHPDAFGRFEMEVTLNEGENTITITATNPAGKTITITRKVKKIKKEKEEEDKTPPILTITSPYDNFITNTPQITIIGISEKGAKVIINGEPVLVDPQGGFKKSLILLEGENIIKVEAKDSAGNSTHHSVKVILDTLPPFLQVTEPPDKYSTTSPDLSIFGFTEKKAKVKIRGEEVTVNPDGSFSKKLILQEGNTTIKIEAIDLAGNTATVTKNIYYDARPPFLTITEPLPDTYVTHSPQVSIVGFTERDSRVFINQKEVYVDPSGNFKQTVSLKEGSNTITITSVDKAGNKITVGKKVIYTDIPPLPPGK